MKRIEIPEFSDKEQLNDWLIENKTLLINQKKSVIKEADAVSLVKSASVLDEKGDAIKDFNEIPKDATNLDVKAIINTTKLLDSHDDVHIDGLWTKSLNENKTNYHVQEHNFSFKGIISDKVKASAQTMSWKELNVDMPGNTQALVFDSKVAKNRNDYMFGQYKDGNVKNHSVGMRYIKLALCMNDPRYKEEFANWEQYLPEVSNKEDAEAKGYFWAVTEAKVVEGSAVPRGSNWITPTQSVSEAGKSTSVEIKNEPVVTTQKESYIFNANLI